MSTIKSSKEFNEIINYINNKNYNQALKSTETLSKNYPKEKILTKLFAIIYFKLMDWNNAIKYYEKILPLENEKWKIYINLGVACFRYGKINKSIDAFKKAINDNPNLDLAYENLAISYLEIGRFEDAIENFIIALKINKNNLNSQENLINVLSLSKPKNKDQHYLVKLDDQINKIRDKHEINNILNEKNIKKILEKSSDLINSSNKNLYLNETQLFRKNSKDLNCKRHFEVFNKFNVIPKYCFSCYKIQINCINVVDLIKLSFIFDDLVLEKNNTRKCIVEIRNQISGNYKGYIYCEGLSDAKNILKKIKKVFYNSYLNKFNISIKHGCSEFYESYPKFQKINFNGKQEMNYDRSWHDKEKSIDSESPPRLSADKKIWTESLRGINLSDILIFNNWIMYAEAIGDTSYKKIYGKKINSSLMKNILKDQLSFRKKNL